MPSTARGGLPAEFGSLCPLLMGKGDELGASLGRDRGWVETYLSVHDDKLWAADYFSIYSGEVNTAVSEGVGEG